jgi:hypothetical protein
MFSNKHTTARLAGGVAVAASLLALSAPGAFGAHDPWYSYASSLTRQATANTRALSAKTEAKGFLALQPKPVDVAQLGAQTEAKGYRAIARYQEQLAAPRSVPFVTDTLAPGGGTVASAPPAVGFDWVDAGIGAAATAGLLLVLLGSGRVLQQHRRRVVAA